MIRDAGASGTAFPRETWEREGQRNNQFRPDPFPAWWASDWGHDEFGLWMAFTYKKVRQVFRWIGSGTFQMGSTELELERNAKRETQHQVTLTNGYWLADTACTQVLWRAVMGDNPSRFKNDANNPVERVSWDDVQQFIEILNTIIPGLDAGLPSEAQWEYACRAGTTTAFSFGENITPQQVNYNGNHSYADGKKGLYRKKTIPVKSLPANPWGLYEMHGNVWEWCQDWFGEYPVEPVEDPLGLENDTYRVLRGGSWLYYGRYVRSADRNGGRPDARSNSIGFRVAPGQAVLGKQETSN